MAPCATNHDTSNAACTNLPKIKNKNNSHFITIKKNDEKCERERERWRGPQNYLCDILDCEIDAFIERTFYAVRPHSLVQILNSRRKNTLKRSHRKFIRFQVSICTGFIEWNSFFIQNCVASKHVGHRFLLIFLCISVMELMKERLRESSCFILCATEEEMFAGYTIEWLYDRATVYVFRSLH